LVVLLFARSLAYSQVLLDPALRLHQSDLAVLESDALRDELPCKVTAEKPVLRFNLRFHGGYTVAVPVRQLAPGGDQLQVRLRITPIAGEADEVLMTDRLNVPAIPEDAKGFGVFPGGFALGPGRYRVDWLMRDRLGRYCSSSWQAEAKLAGSERGLPVGLAPNTVAALDEESYPAHATQNGDGRESLHLKILLNLAPADTHRSVLDTQELEVMRSLLQNFGRQQQFRSFTLVAFNIHTQKVIHRQENVPHIDMLLLKAAIEKSDAGTINYRSLFDPRSESKFIGGLLADELSGGMPQPDFVVVAGPKASVEGKVPVEQLKDLGETSFPIFYFSHVADPAQNPFRDSISAALKTLKTTSEFKITQPRDMGIAIRQVISWLSTRRSTGLRTSQNTGRTEYAGYMAGSN
jgi:hypothetical protein